MDLLSAEKHCESTSESPLSSPPQASLHGTSGNIDSQDYFSAGPIAICLRPEHIFLAQVVGRTRHARSTSTDSVASTPSFLRPCADLATSPSQRAISFLSWSRYSPSSAATPSGHLKASDLCKASGTTPSYDPPVSEWTFLGAGQPVYSGKPFVRQGPHRRQKGSGSSSTLSSMTLADEQSGAITFTKRPVKRISTSSQLTASLQDSSHSCTREGPMTAMQRMGLEGMTCADLPSAFDDSEDEED